MTDYDLLVIGAGPGGYVAAIKAARLGKKVALVEEREIGGTCLNRGCIPTKTLLHASHLYRELSLCGEFGITVEKMGIDTKTVHDRKDAVTKQLREGIERLLQANDVTILRGHATLLPGLSAKIEDKTVRAGKILIATGSVPIRIPIPGSDLPGIVTSDEMLAGVGDESSRLVIVGGGVIGVEFATLHNAFGRKVTVIEAMDRLLPTMDKELSQALGMILKRRGVQIYTGAKVESFTRNDDGLVCRLTVKGEERVETCDAVLLSVGRRPNTEGLFDPSLGLELPDGAIAVDGNFQTVLPGVYAVGDVIEGSIRLAHAASAQGTNAVSAMFGGKTSVDTRFTPLCVYTDPEIASVGITEAEAKKNGTPVKMGKFLMSANGKNIIEMADRGFVKLLFHAENDRLVGAQLMCPRATDMIGELSTALVNGLTAEELCRVVRAHPTFGEAVTEAAEDANDRATHSLPRRR